MALEPLGLLEATPVEFRWTASPGANRYRLMLETVDGATIWCTDVQVTKLETPSQIAAELQPGVAYFWHVEAMDDRETVTAVSTRVRFQIRLGPPAPERGAP